MEFPNLATERLILRQTTVDDKDEIYTIFSDIEVMEFYDLDPITTISGALEIIKHHDNLLQTQQGVRWAITLRSTGKLIGTCGFQNKNAIHSSASLGYDLARQFWGQGYMLEALQAVLHYGFNQYGLNRIQATTNLDSARSIATLHRLKFHEEGILRQVGFWKGRFHDLRYFSLLKTEFTLV